MIMIVMNVSKFNESMCVCVCGLEYREVYGI